MGYFCLNQMFFHIFTDCYISYGIILLFIGLRRVNGTFLLHGLRTEFKRIWPYGHSRQERKLVSRSHKVSR